MAVPQTVKRGRFTTGAKGTVTTVELGFKPSVLITFVANTYNLLRMYDSEFSTLYQITASFSGDLATDSYALPNTSEGAINSITNTGFTFNGSSDTSKRERVYIAIS